MKIQKYQYTLGKRNQRTPSPRKSGKIEKNQFKIQDLIPIIQMAECVLDKNKEENLMNYLNQMVSNFPIEKTGEPR